jgi:DNA-binding protein YbaB
VTEALKGPEDQLPIIQAALAKFGGVGGVGAEVTAEALGVSEEQLQELQAFLDSNETVKGTLAGIEEVLRVKGIKINQSFLDNKVAKVIEDSTLKSLRTALIEQALFMLATTDPEKLKGWKKDMGGSAEDVIARTYEWLTGPDGVTNFKDLTMKGRAAGGLVTSIAGGLAQVSPAPGEGLTSIGVGERIVPRGAGGGTQQVEVVVRLDGDMTKKLIKAQASNAIVEHAAAAPRR